MTTTYIRKTKPNETKVQFSSGGAKMWPTYREGTCTGYNTCAQYVSCDELQGLLSLYMVGSACAR